MVFDVQLDICIQFRLNTHIVHACQFRNVYAHGFDGLYRSRCCGSCVLIAIKAFCKQNTHAHIEVRMIGRTSCSGEQHTHTKHIYMRTLLNRWYFKPRIQHTPVVAVDVLVSIILTDDDDEEDDTENTPIQSQNNAIPMHIEWVIRGHSFGLKYIANCCFVWLFLFRGKLIETFNKIFGWIVWIYTSA